MKRFKLQEVFTIPEKRTFIETLLIIAGIMTGLNPSPLTLNIFVVFASSSISYIIVISIIKKRVKDRKFTRVEFYMNWIISIICGIFFSALVLVIGLQANIMGAKTFNDILTIFGGWITIYFMLGFLLILVLGLINTKTKSLKK